MSALSDTQVLIQKLGRYQIVRELGKGATSRVYLAEDLFARRKVAIKVAFPDALKSREESAFYKNMFLTEASLAGKLVHPHIAQIFDAVVEEDFSYIVMEYVDGGTLEKFCGAENLLEPPEIAEIRWLILDHLADHHEFHGEKSGVRIARKHLAWYTAELDGGAAFRHEINAIDDAAAQIAAVNRFFDELSTHGDRLAYAPKERVRRISSQTIEAREARAA